MIRYGCSNVSSYCFPWKHIWKNIMSVLELLVSLSGCKIYGKIELEARESRNSLVS